jgi:hypothetical protein
MIYLQSDHIAGPMNQHHFVNSIASSSETASRSRAGHPLERQYGRPAPIPTSGSPSAQNSAPTCALRMRNRSQITVSSNVAARKSQKKFTNEKHFLMPNPKALRIVLR